MRKPVACKSVMRTCVAISAFALISLLSAGCSTLNTLGMMLGSQVTFTQPQLQHSLNRNFPKQYERLGGLVSLRLTNPTLSIPHDNTRLRLSFDIRLSAMDSTSMETLGHFTLSSGLRFDQDTQGLHLRDPVIESVDLPGLGGVMNATSRELLSAWLSDYAREEPVYRLDSSLLERISARRIESTDIERGLVVVKLDE